MHGPMTYWWFCFDDFMIRIITQIKQMISDARKPHHVPQPQWNLSRAPRRMMRSVNRNS